MLPHSTTATIKSIRTSICHRRTSTTPPVHRLPSGASMAIISEAVRPRSRRQSHNHHCTEDIRQDRHHHHQHHHRHILGRSMIAIMTGRIVSLPGRRYCTGGPAVPVDRYDHRRPCSATHRRRTMDTASRTVPDCPPVVSCHSVFLRSVSCPVCRFLVPGCGGIRLLEGGKSSVVQCVVPLRV